MTDQPTPTDDDLSLALDGEADAELLARIEASPEARARLAELRAAADLVATSTVEPLDDDTVDDLISTALDTPVAPARTANARRGRGRATPWLVAASVIVLMAIGLSLVWAGRGTQDDQASAKFDSVGASISTESSGKSSADESFSAGAATAGDAADTGSPVAGGHGSPTTVVPSTSTADVPVVFLGTYDSADALREATAVSWADALKASGTTLTFETGATDNADVARRAGVTPPKDASVDRCAEQLQVTLSLKAGPIQRGYATVDGKDVLVYEFATTSARDGKDTTLVAAVGTSACDEVVFFER